MKSFSSTNHNNINNNNPTMMIPHQGGLYRVVDEDAITSIYVIDMDLSSSMDSLSQQHHHQQQQDQNQNHHELKFTVQDFDFCQKLFAILDTESRGAVDRLTIKEFVTLRCPVFCRRDDDLRRIRQEEERRLIGGDDNNNNNNNNDILHHHLHSSGRRNNNRNKKKSTTTTKDNYGGTITAAEEEEEESPTFDEVWKSVVESCSSCCISSTGSGRRRLLTPEDLKKKDSVQLGVEGWMVFCRFIALAQYLEAKRRFSARHLQQTMRHRNSPRGSEVVVVDVPPQEPPAPLSREQLAQYERKNRSPLPLPELDLDHSMLAAHDLARRRGAATSGSSSSSSRCQQQGTVKISLFGSSSHHHHHHHQYDYSSSSSSSGSNDVEFKVSYIKNASDQVEMDAPIVVRRSMEDMKWLNDTFKAHKVLGGTLCGRILPPFPGSTINGKILASQFQRDGCRDTTSLLHLNTSTIVKNTTGGAIAAAAAGVEIIKDVAKSFWKSDSSLSSSSKKKNTSNSRSSSSSTSSPASSTSVSTSTKLITKKNNKKPSTSSLCLALPESYYNPNSPAGKARQMERYLNYLLEHPALSTSFPLNTILKASQSGLEAAKQSLEECQRLSKEVKEQTPQMTDGKTIVPFWGSNSVQPSLSWVRTAAQAAMALKVHGILETTGMQSASAMLQHASLPNFEGPKNLDWVDEEEQQQQEAHANAANQDRLSASDRANSFEQGVVSVQSELQAEIRPPNDDDGYDLLPLPIPAPERRILSAGSRTAKPVDSSSSSSPTGRAGGGGNGSPDSQQQTRFHYGTPTQRLRLPTDEEDDGRATFLGDISEMIGSLREVIGSVDNTLSRCLASSGGIGRARREQGALHLSIVQGFDSWIGLRGKFIGQRALLKGVSGIEQSNEVYEESDLALIDDVSWQASLANSAVSAAEDVRSAVRAAKTAENAKAAASAAAFAAQSACDAGGFPSIDEARAAQTRASIAQSHAFHAAVVDHEAKAVKRRATLALAHDVKCWNVHRKREMLQACLAHARSQHEATRRAVDAWSCLRDGYIGSNALPSAQTRKAPPAVQTVPPSRIGRPLVEAPRAPRAPLVPVVTGLNTSTPPPVSSNVDILSSDAFADMMSQSTSKVLSQSAVQVSGVASSGGLNDTDASGMPPPPPPIASDSQQESEHEEPTATIYQDSGNVIVAVDHNVLSHQEPLPAPMAKSGEHSVEKNNSSDSAILPFAQNVLPLVTAAPVPEVTVAAKEDPSPEEAPPKPSDDNESMSASMASLVDGLMTWGGQFETDDILALPQGMAASIAFEETNAASPQSTF